MATSQAYSLNNKRDHDGIVVIGVQLFGMMTNPMFDRTRVSQGLNSLKASLLLHFSEEESVMKAQGYPGLPQHKRSHDYIMSILADFMSAFAVGREGVDPDLWPHLEHTLDNHMARYDAELETYLSGRGVAVR